MSEQREQPIIAFGNPLDGISFIGPFETVDAAVEWGERYLPEAENDGNFFWITPLFDPDTWRIPADGQPQPSKLRVVK